MCSLWGFALLEINSYLSKRKKEIINPSQSAFVHGRSIADNVLITQDLMHNYHRNNGRPRCALKIDIKKAYDTIGWSCVIDILYRL